MKKFQGIKQKQIIPKLFSSARAIVIGLALFVLPTQVFALTAQEEWNQIQAENQVLQGQANQKKQEAKTITGQISVLNSRISQTQSEIYSANAKISSLASDIITTGNQIEAKGAELKERQGQLGITLVEMYEYGQQSNFELILKSESFSDFVNTNEYLLQMQQKIKQETDKIIGIKNELNIQKGKLENDKKTVEQTKSELVAKQAEVQSQRSTQSYLLSMTESQKKAYETEISSNNARKGALYCIIYGCGTGDVNGDIVVKNNFSPYYSQLNYTENYVLLTSGRNTCPSCTIRNYGCLITSLSMVRSYFGTPTDPIGEMYRHTYDSQGYMQGWDFAGKPKVQISKSSIGNYLDAGKPVIVELDLGAYSHFIALFQNHDGTFFANDPAFRANTTYNLSRVVRAYSTNY